MTVSIPNINIAPIPPILLSISAFFYFKKIPLLYRLLISSLVYLLIYFIEAIIILLAFWRTGFGM